MASTAVVFDTDCVLMLHCDGTNGSTTITDSSYSAPNTMTAQGNAQISTAQSVFGGASLALDGTGDYVNTPTFVGLDFGTGDYTIDYRFWTNDTLHDAYPIGCGFDTGWAIFQSNLTTIRIYLENTAVNNQAFVPVINTWYHIAITRTGTTVNTFVNGSSIGTASNSTNVDASAELDIGRDASDARYVNGFMDEIRVVKGTSVWSSNFTPPSAAYVPAAVSTNKFDTVTVSESVTVQIIADVLSVSDTVTSTENLKMMMDLNININQGISVLDVPIMNSDIPIAIVDMISTTESVTMLMTLFINVNEAISVAETVNNSQIVYNISVFDTVTVTEASGVSPFVNIGMAKFLPILGVGR